LVLWVCVRRGGRGTPGVRRGLFEADGARVAEPLFVWVEGGCVTQGTGGQE